MSGGIEERITEVLAKHHFWWANHSSIGSNAHCRCGERPHGLAEWNTHIAAVLRAELGLTQEWGVAYEGKSEPDSWTDDLESAQEEVQERCQSCDHCRNAAPKTLMTRYVTAGEPAS